MSHKGTKARRYEGKAAFTIIEMLVVIGVVVVLLSLLMVAVNAATRIGQVANTQTLMNSIKQALIRFEGDIGYLPPVLGAPVDEAFDFDPQDHVLRKLFGPRGFDGMWGDPDDLTPDHPTTTGEFAPNTSYVDNIQEWYSYTSLAEYLLGYGNHYQDGYGIDPAAAVQLDWDTETPALGIRNPERDRGFS